ncbi:hypothetical protein [Larkinella soli]|uniref:hypothetical protein n=1 Tax=Larkinella soli TaxID=1770527 RepID=UPI0013E3710E|nr:hypothetical protein [Larkinella soli]
MNYVTPYKYAKLCGVSHQAIYERIQRGLIEVVQIPSPDGQVKNYIDTDRFPPQKLRK